MVCTLVGGTFTGVYCIMYCCSFLTILFIHGCYKTRDLCYFEVVLTSSINLKIYCIDILAIISTVFSSRTFARF